jgi:hypothetical protein
LSQCQTCKHARPADHGSDYQMKKLGLFGCVFTPLGDVLGGERVQAGSEAL